MIEAASQSIEIGSNITGKSLQHLRSDIIRGGEKMRLGHGLGSRAASKTEIPQLGPSVTGEENIGGLQVTVHDPTRLGRGKRLEHLHPDPQDTRLAEGLRHGMRRGDTFMKRPPLHEFHHQASSMLILLQRENLYNRGMIHQPGGDRLIPQEHQMFLVIGRRFFQHLEGHLTDPPVLLCAPYAKNPSAPTPTCYFENLVPANSFPDPDFGSASGTADH